MTPFLCSASIEKLHSCLNLTQTVSMILETIERVMVFLIQIRKESFDIRFDATNLKKTQFLTLASGV